MNIDVNKDDLMTEVEVDIMFVNPTMNEIMNEVFQSTSFDELEIEEKLNEEADVKGKDLFETACNNHKLLTIEEEKELFHALRNGDLTAKDKIVNSNLRLVKSVANHCYNVTEESVLSFEDVNSAGLIGLMRAIELFDVDLGYKFCTYAMWWIKQAIFRAIGNESRIIRQPIHMSEFIRKMKKMISQFTETYGYEPDDEELSGLLDVSVERIKSAKASIYNEQIVSLDSFLRVGEDDGETYGNMLVDERQISVENQVLIRDLHERMDKLLSYLTPREQMVLKSRFYNDEGVHTLDEIGKEMGITRERVRQIEQKALRRIRVFSDRTKLLHGYGNKAN